MDPCKQIKNSVPVLADFPKRITLELTNRCNLACVFCPRQLMEKERGNMDLALARELIGEMAGYAPLQIVPFFRGEPLLHPEWDSILELIKKHSVGEIQFTTNAVRLGAYEARRILELNIDFVSFSIDTLDPDLYNQIRRGADYSACIANVLRFLSLRDAMGAHTQVQISAVETEDTKHRMDDFVAYWRSKADRVRVYLQHSEDGNPGSLSEFRSKLPSREPCHKVFTDMIVYWDGTVGLCNHDWTRPKSGPRIGDLTSATISEIWNSETYQEIRRQHLDGKIDGLNPCRGCDHWLLYYLPESHIGRVYTKTGGAYFSHPAHSSVPS